MSSDRRVQSVEEAVLEKIRTGQAKMTPRSHFVARAALAVLGIAIIVAVLVYLVSFTFFTLRLTGVWFAPTFGLPGWQAVLGSLPWLLVMATVVFVLWLEFLVKRYPIAYHKPLLYSALWITALALFAGYVVARTPFHTGFYRYAHEHHLPFIGEFYESFGEQRFQGLHAGMVTERTAGGFLMTTRRGDELTVVVTPETRFPFGASVAVGDTVVVIGDRTDETVRAFGIRTIGRDVPFDTLPYGRLRPQMRRPLP